MTTQTQCGQQAHDDTTGEAFTCLRTRKHEGPHLGWPGKDSMSVLKAICDTLLRCKSFAIDEETGRAFHCQRQHGHKDKRHVQINPTQMASKAK